MAAEVAAGTINNQSILMVSKIPKVSGTPGHSRTQYDLRIPDADPMARFRAGDREAFTLIYQLHSPAVKSGALDGALVSLEALV